MRQLPSSPRIAVVAVLLVAALLAPGRAGAVTVDQIVALAHAGVTDTVILALIDRDKTILDIQPEQLVALQRDGLSDAVITAMLKSGREEGEEAARAVSAFNTATIMSALSLGPETVLVGHGPEIPNTAHVDGFYSGPPGSAYYGAVPYAYPAFRSRSSRRATAPAVAVRAPLLCTARTSTGRSAANPAFDYVTECPAVMQTRAPR
jgi:hypothetical protein